MICPDCDTKGEDDWIFCPFDGETLITNREYEEMREDARDDLKMRSDTLEKQ